MTLEDARDWVGHVFHASEHRVTTEVGPVPGTLDRFAVPNSVLSGSRIFWTVIAQAPEDPAQTLRALEDARRRTGSSKAIGLVIAELPHDAGGSSDQPAVLMSLRQFAVEASGLREAAEKHSKRTSGSPARCATVGGRSVDPVQFIVDWSIEAATGDRLYLLDPAHDDYRPTEFRFRAALAQRFLDGASAWTMPEGPQLSSIWRTLLRAVEIRPIRIRTLRRRGSPIRRLSIATSRSTQGATTDVELLPVGLEEQSEWLASNLKPQTRALWQQATALEPELTRWVGVPTRQTTRSMEQAAERATSPVNWCALLVHLGSVSLADPEEAFEAFALGEPRESWEPELAENRLDFEYGVAQHLSERFAAGDLEVLARHRLPERWVLAFLAVINPEAAARATADRSESLRREIRAEVEQQLDLVLGHQLRRSAGTAKAILKRIDRRLPSPLRESLKDDLADLRDELDFQRRLARTTSQYHQRPTDFGPVDLDAQIKRAISPLRAAGEGIDWRVDTGTDLRVNGDADAVREILHNLLENALHAARRTAAAGWVGARALSIGEEVHVVVENNGPGIREADREAIFEPRVTTKKGGEQPLGTGMGLPIARRYAEAMGGRLELDVDAPHTRFVLRLVATKEAP